MTDKHRRQRGLVPLAGILQQLTPDQRAKCQEEDEARKKAEQDVGLEQVHTIPDSDSENDSTDDDYVPMPSVPPMSPRAHDPEAGRSGTTRTDAEVVGSGLALSAPQVASLLASMHSELAQLTSTVHILTKSLIATQVHGAAVETYSYVSVSLNYLYQQIGVPMPQYPLLVVPQTGLQFPQPQLPPQVSCPIPQVSIPSFSPVRPMP